MSSLSNDQEAMETGYEYEDESAVSGSPLESSVASFHFANEVVDASNVKVGKIRKHGATTLRRRRNVSRTSVEDNADPRDSFDRIRQKFSAIHGPADLNNNRGVDSGDTDLYSTPMTFKRREEEKFFTPGELVDILPPFENGNLFSWI